MYIIAGKFYKQKIQTPKGNSTRPTASRLRETLFNILQNDIENSNFLDIFAGSGAVGIEAISRGAKSSTFIEKDRFAFQTLNENLKKLNITSEARILFGDFIKHLQLLGKKKEQFDYIFADAPYHLDNITNLILEQIATNNLLNKMGLLFIENDKPFSNCVNCYGLTHINSRKSGKSYLHQFKVN